MPAPTSADGRAVEPTFLSRLASLASRPLIQALAATAAYAAFAIYLTWPLVTDLGGTLYGAAGDMTGAISIYRELIESGEFPFAPGTLDDFNAPDGLDIRWTLNLMTLPAFASMYGLSAVFGPIAAIGIYTLLGFTLSGLAMFLFVRRLLDHPGVAFVAGYAYAFYPFVVVKAQGHVDFVHGWVLVLPVWRLYELIERPSVRNGAWAGLAVVFAFAWTPYHILFTGVAAVALGAAAIALAWRRRLLRPTVAALAVTAGIAGAWLVGASLVDRAAQRSEVRTQTIQEATAFSARAAEYVVPTSEHPLFGEQAGEYRLDHLHGSNRAENTLYVGGTVLALALAGLIFGLLQGGRLRRVAVAAATLAVAAFAFSAPPEVDLLGLTFPTATKFLFELTASWRVFSRLVVVVMLALVVLAAIGMFFIVRRRALALQAALLAVLLVVIGADLWARPAQGTNKLIVPDAYNRLAQMPPGTAVEYPLVPAEQSQYGDVFYQGWHDKPIVNGFPEGSPEENRALRLADLSDPATARGLKALGVRYVLVRRDIEAGNLPDPGRPGPEFQLRTRDPYIAVYELKVPGPQALVTPMEGFTPPEDEGRRRYQWMVEPQGTLEVLGACSPCEGTVAFQVRSFAQPREIVVRDSSGRERLRTRIADSKRIRVPVRFDRRLDLRIEASPGPRSITEATGSPDPRSVSVAILRESFQFAREGDR